MVVPVFEENTIVCGDCLDVIAEMPDGCVDLVVTDPPYGKRFHDGGLGSIPSKKWANPPTISRFAGVKIIGDNVPNPAAIVDLRRVLRVGGACYVFTQWMVESIWVDALRTSGLTARNCLVWVKPFHGAGDLKTTYGPQHERISYATNGRHELRGKRDGDVWLEPVGPNGCFRKGKIHPTQKPLGLCSWLIEKSSDEGDLVFDPFMGSGTTAVAADRLGRRWFGCDVSEEYVAMALERIAKDRLGRSQMELGL